MSKSRIANYPEEVLLTDVLPKYLVVSSAVRPSAAAYLQGVDITCTISQTSPMRLRGNLWNCTTLGGTISERASSLVCL